jgi:hypothetical protein
MAKMPEEIHVKVRVDLYKEERAVIEAAKAWADLYDPDDRYLIALEKAVEALQAAEGEK